MTFLARVTAVVPAAGSGTRVGAKRSKVLLPLAGAPVLVWTLRALEACPCITDVLVAARPQDQSDIAALLAMHPLGKVAALVDGGRERQESVCRALPHIPAASDFVLIHDAARPLVTSALCQSVCQAALEVGAATCAVPCSDTVKVVNAEGIVERTLDRRTLWLVQTPQAFRKDLLLQAHEAAQREGFTATDDATLVERLGQPVKVVMGRYDNLKITEAGDFERAGWALKGRVNGSMGQ